MIRRPPRSTLSSSSAASDVYKRQVSTQSTGDLTMRTNGSGMALGSLLMGIAMAAQASACGMAPYKLRCNNLVNPLGVDATVPALSWGLVADHGSSNKSQSAYQITVTRDSSAHIPPVWDSGKILSSATLGIPYGGVPLAAGDRVRWRVQLWDEHGVACAPSAWAWWEMGLINASGWGNAQWVSRGDGPPSSECEMYSDRPGPQFRREIKVKSQGGAILSARVYVTGLGYFKVWLDGERVWDGGELEPAWSEVRDVVYYRVFDVTSRMGNSGVHAFGVELGNGWFNPLPLRFWGHVNLRDSLLVGEPMFIFKLVITRADGTKQVVDSQPADWTAGRSSTIFNNIYIGEKQDLRLQSIGWSKVGYNDSTWKQAVLGNATGIGKLRAQSIPPIRPQEWLDAVVISEQTNGTGRVLVLDTGKNHAGSCIFNVTGRRGDRVEVKYGELLDEDGQVNPMTSVAGQIKAPNPSAPCQPSVAYQVDTWVLGGGDNGSERLSGPGWGWHAFRYMQVAVPASVVLNGAPTCSVLRTDLDRISTFSSSAPVLAGINQIITNSYDSNLMSVQSDCPHRERFGYGGDALASGEAGLSLYDLSSFYSKRVTDYNAAQRQNGGFTETAPFVGIGDAGLGNQSGPIGWQSYQPVAQLWLYKYYGNTETLEASRPYTERFMKLLDSDPAGITAGLGDWMPVEPTAVNFTGLGFLRMSYLAMSNISLILKDSASSAVYRSKADAVTERINRLFLNTSTGTYAVGGRGDGGSSQCGQGMSIFEGIVPAAQKTQAVAALRDGVTAATNLTNTAGQGPVQGGSGPHITAGMFGIKWALMALSDNGLNDLAFEAVSSPSFPSLGWMMKNQFANATTTWESYFYSNNTFSHNHPMFGSYTVWLMQSVGGIQPHPAANGMDRVLIKPRPPQAPVSYTHLRAHETPEHLVCRLLLEKKKKRCHTSI
eukprot:TRINITY_DN4418_c0_g1_i7.p1 TRINITY_DN4418_c0_g1~~TRINITY_DN4418_c0_g1_i7.p1  ORF type:complete len:942 (-),score=181.87 TRINITY_DN4418_c0_g1_i7:39-2864(-)